MDTVTSNNGWQNIGILYKHAIQNGIEPKELPIFMFIVENSVGFLEPFTNSLPSPVMAKKCGVSRPTWTKITKSMEEKGLIKRVGHYGNLKDGGSTAFKYGPVFPKNIKIKLKGDECERDTIKTQEVNISNIPEGYL